MDLSQKILSEDISFLEQESDPRILRELVRFVCRQSADIAKDNERLRVKIATQDAEKQLTFDTLTDAYSILRNQFFGRGRERLAGSALRDREKKEEDLLLFSRSLVPELKDKDTEGLGIKEVSYELSADLLTKELHRRHPELSSIVPDWKLLPGLEEVATEVTVVERTYEKVLHKRSKYKAVVVDPVSFEEKSIFITAPGPAKLLPGCTYSVDFGISVVVDKFLMHLPLERQRRQMQSLGLKGVTTKTLYNQCWAVSQHLLPVYAGIEAEIKISGLCVHTDETPWPIHSKKDSDGYMWVFSNMAGAHYRFEPTRSGKVAAEYFKGFQGGILSDGYSGYDRLENIEGIKLAGCWAHARRKFFEIAESHPGHDAEDGVKIIDELFAIDRKAKSFEELRDLRSTESTKVMERFEQWLEAVSQKHLPKSSLMKAVGYYIKQRQGLRLFLSDEKIPLSNNDAERALRHAVVGRKNYYGSQSIDGADCAAILFSIIESCKRVGLDPAKFIKMAVYKSIAGEPVPTPLAHAKVLAADIAA